MKWSKWIQSLDPNYSLQIEYEKSVQHNMDFVLSLDKKQLDYYLNLKDSWRKELTKLEKRVSNLEVQK